MCWTRYRCGRSTSSRCSELVVGHRGAGDRPADVGSRRGSRRSSQRRRHRGRVASPRPPSRSRCPGRTPAPAPHRPARGPGSARAPAPPGWPERSQRSGPRRWSSAATPMTAPARARRPAAGIACRRGSPGPGAGSPKLRSSRRHPNQASLPVTFCSMTAATSDSRTSPDRGTRQCGLRAPGTAHPRVRRLEPGDVVVGAEELRAPARASRQRRSPRRRARSRRAPGEGLSAASPAPSGVIAARHTTPSASR